MEPGLWTSTVIAVLFSYAGNAEGGSTVSPWLAQDAESIAWSRAQPARGPAGEGDRTPASALVFEPMSAESPDGGLEVTLVASHANAERPRTVYALLVRPDRLARWVPMPMPELPEAVVCVDDRTIVCVARDAARGTMLLTLDAEGQRLRRTSLSELLPPGARRSAGATVSLAASHAGRCLAVELECGGIALLDFDDDRASGYRLCTVQPSAKHACGIEAWLDQSRELLRVGDVDAARFALEAAIESNPDDPRGYRELASFYERTGDREAMIACLRDGLERTHRDIDGSVTGEWQVGTPHARLALEYVHATRAVKGEAGAHDALAETLALYPCMEQAVLLQAELLLDVGQDQAAIATIESALSRLAVSANVAAAYHDVGRFLARRDLDELALRYLEDAYALGDTSEFLIRTVADIHVDNDRFSDAVDWLERLADQWRRSSNGDSALLRTLRGFRRLADLEREVAELRGRAAAPTER